MSRRKQARPIKVHEDDITKNGIQLLSNVEQNTLMPCKEIVNGACGANSGSLHQLSENGDSVESCSEDDVLIPDTQELSCPNYPEPHKVHDENISENIPMESIDSPRKIIGIDLPALEDNTLNETNNPDESTSSIFTPGYVTLEALENTKVAVAQFAATALANGADQTALKELAMLQSTLYTLQHQQVYQIKLIEELQSQLAKQSTPTTTTTSLATPTQSPITTPTATPTPTLTQPITTCDSSEKTYELMCEIDLKKVDKINCDGNDSKSCESVIKVTQPKFKVVDITQIQNDHIKEIVSIPSKSDINTITPSFGENQNPKSPIKLSSISPQLSSNIPSQMRAPMCHISSSFASSIITNHATPSSINEPNSLEMLQKTAEEVLDSASQGLLSGNLIDELAFRKNKSSDGDDKNDAAYKHRCRYCAKIFGSDSALQIHLRSHTGERPFKCNVCGSRFTTRGNLKVHFQRHTQFYPHLQMNSNPMPEHMDMHKSSIYASLSPPPPPPPPSSFPYSTRSMITRHSMYKPPDYPKLIQTSEDRHSMYQPPDDYPKLILTEDRHTNISHANSDSRFNHLSNEVAGNKIRAEDKSTYRNNANQNAASDDEDEVPIRKQPHRSTKDMKTTYENQLNATTNNNEQSWKQFIKTSETSKLQKLVDNIEHKLTDPNECMICHRVLQSRTALEHHYKMHSDGCEKPTTFQCKICERSFGTKGNLKAHMSIHEQRPAFEVHPQCPVCHKRYINLLVLQQHIKEHTGEPTEMTAEQIRAAEIRDLDKFKTTSIDIDDDYNEEELLEDEAYNNRMNNISSENISNVDSDDSQQEFRDRKSGPIIIDMNEREQFIVKLTEPSVTPLSQHTSGSESVVQMEQSSPTPSELSQSSALDLRPRQQFSYSPSSSSMNGGPSPHHHHPIGLFPNFPFLSQHPAHSPTPLQYNAALNSLAHSVMPNGSFNPLGFPGLRGNTTCNICFKTFACHSALEIHYRSHTKERPFKCGVCDRGFSTKGNMKQHMLTHKIRDMPQHMFTNSTSRSQSSESAQSYGSSYFPSKDYNQRSTSTEKIFDDKIPDNDESIDDDTSSMQKDHTTTPYKEYHTNFDPENDKSHQPDSNLNSMPTVPIDGQHFIAHETLYNDELKVTNKLCLKSSIRDADEYSSMDSEIDDHVNEIKSNLEIRNINDLIENQKHLCGVCKRNFSSTSAVHIHMRTHTGDKPFQCSVCKKAFTTKGNLKVHMGTHVWSGGPSRRGRRMSLEFSLGRPLAADPEYLRRHPNSFYPYYVPYINGTPNKYHFGETSTIQSVLSSGRQMYVNPPNSTSDNLSSKSENEWKSNDNNQSSLNLALLDRSRNCKELVVQ